MTLDELKKVVKTESDRHEFKSTTGELGKACATICAFLNNHGGTVFIGVKNDGRLVGQMVTDSTKQEIANELRKIEPPALVKVSYVPFNGENVMIVIEVSQGDHVPYVYDGRPYHRIESRTSVMPQHLYEQLMIKKRQLNHAWDEFVSDRYSEEDLDHDEIRKTMKHGIGAARIPGDAINENILDILAGFELLENGKLKNAAIVLFAKNVSPLYSQCMIKMARFRGLKETEDFIDNQQSYGNAFKILEEANSFMRRHLSIASFYQPDSFVRIDKPTLPVLAVREAVINAIVHRDYSQQAAAITLAIFDNRLEVWNNGFLPKELRIEDLKEKHRSYPRNRLIAKTFYKRGLIEGWGTGTVKIFERCREHGIPDPIFEEYSGGISVQFLFSESIQRIGDHKRHKVSSVKMSKRQREILQILSEVGELKSRGIIEKLQAPLLERTLRRDLAALKKLGLIDYRGRGPNAFWFKNLP